MVSKLNSNRAPGEAFGSAMGRIYKDIGFGGLWNGLPVRIVMIGTLTGLQWMIYVSGCWSCFIGDDRANAVAGLLQDLYGPPHYGSRCPGKEVELVLWLLLADTLLRHHFLVLAFCLAILLKDSFVHDGADSAMLLHVLVVYAGTRRWVRATVSARPEATTAV